MEPVSVAVVGTGDWGGNLLRNFANLPGARVAAVCDSDRTSSTFARPGFAAGKARPQAQTGSFR